MSIRTTGARAYQFLGGVVMSYAYQAIVMVAGLWLTPFLLRHIGKHDYGIWLLATQILGYLALADFGIIALVPRDVAYATGSSESNRPEGELREVVGQTMRIVLWQMPAVCLAALGVWFFLGSGQFRGILAVILFSFVIQFPIRIFGAVLLGLQDLRYIGRVQIYGWVLTTCLSIGLVLAGAGFYALAISWGAGQLLINLLSWQRLRARFPEALPTSWPKLPWSVAKERLSHSVWISIQQIGQVFLDGSDLLILGKVAGPAAVVTYSCTGKLISVLSNQPQIIMHAAFPGLSQMKAGDSRTRLMDVMTTLRLALLLMSGALVCVVLAVNEPFVTWWVGRSNFGGGLLSALLLVNMLCRHMNTTLAFALFACGRERRLTITTLADGVVTVACAALFTRLLGPVGTALGTIAGVSLVSLPTNLRSLAQEGHVSPADLLLPLWGWFWRLVLLVVFSWAVGHYWKPAGFWGFATAASLVFLVYAAAMIPVFLRSRLKTYVAPWLSPALARMSAAA